MAILKMSLSASILILAIVIIRALALHKLPKKTFLVLWGIALCRLLIPISIQSRFSVYTVFDMLKNKFSVADTSFMGIAAPNIAMTTGKISSTLANTTTVSVSPIMVIWIIGLSVCALFFLVTHFRCRREYKTALPIDNKLVKDWQQEHPTRRKVKIRQSDKIAAPLTYGILCPVVLLPKKTDWADESRLRYILTHEFVHIKRVDTLIKLLLAAALCVHWFNPFVWVMYVLANRDIELSCDETVIRTFGETMKSAYALTLIGLEEKKSRLTPLVNNFSKNIIEERIVSIMKMKKASLGGIILALALVVGTTTVFATNTIAAKADNAKNDIAVAAGEQGNNSNASAVSLGGLEKEPNDEDWKKAIEEFERQVENDKKQLREDAAKTFSAYKKYGLTYNQEEDQLYYNGKAVTHFEDNISKDGSFNGEIYNCPNGKISIRTIRNTVGEVTGLETFSWTSIGSNADASVIE